MSDALYEPYAPQRLTVMGAKPHPTLLVESASMASVLPPTATYRPKFPQHLIDSGTLSLPQLEAIVYSGQAHERMLPPLDRLTTNQRRDLIEIVEDRCGRGLTLITSQLHVDQRIKNPLAPPVRIAHSDDGAAADVAGASNSR